MKASVKLGANSKISAKQSLDELSVGVSKLEILSVSECGLEALIEWVQTSSLKSIIFIGSNIENNHFIRGVERCLIVSRITSLAFHKTSISDDDIYSLVNCSAVAQLDSLIFLHNPFGSRGVKFLANSQYLAQLKHLALSGNNNTPESTSMLADSPNLRLSFFLMHYLCYEPRRLLPYTKNQNLYLTSCNMIGVSNVQELMSSECLKMVGELFLVDVRLDDDGLIELARSPYLRYFTWLNLNNNLIGTKGVQALANSPYVDNLKRLSLSNNSIDADGAEVIALSQELKSLIEIDLSGNPIKLPHTTLTCIEQLRNEFLVSNIETKTPNPYVRVMIIGEPNVGKTTLYKRMTGKEVYLGREARTHGIDFGELDGFQSFSYIHDEQEYFVEPKVSLWDTGGQRIQQMGHGLFVDSTRIYILVMGESTTKHIVKHWLDMLMLRSSSSGITIIPIINLKSEKANSINQDDVGKYKKLYGRYLGEFTWCEPLPVNLVEANADIYKVRNTLDSVLRRYQFSMDWKAINDISSEYNSSRNIFASGSYSSSKPYDKRDSFIDDLLEMKLFTVALERIQAGLAASGKPNVIDYNSFADLIIEHMNSLGIITILHFYNKIVHGEKDKPFLFEKKQSESIILHDLAWVQRGIYALFPPEDDDQYQSDIAREFINALKGDENEFDLPGVFTLPLVEKYWSELKIKKHHQMQLLNLLMHDRLNIVTRLPGSNDVYFVPAYLEKKNEDSNAVTLEDVKQVDKENKEGRGGSCWVIKAPENVWPSHFIYTHMARTATRASNKDSIFQWRTDEKPKARHYKLQLINKPNALVEVFFIDEALWCFTYPEKGCKSFDYKGVLQDLFSDFQDLYSKSRSNESSYKLSAYIPCPECMDIIQSETKVEFLWLHEVSTLEGTNFDSEVRCKNQDLYHLPVEVRKLFQGELSSDDQPGISSSKTYLNGKEFSSSLRSLIQFLIDSQMVVAVAAEENVKNTNPTGLTKDNDNSKGERANLLSETRLQPFLDGGKAQNRSLYKLANVLNNKCRIVTTMALTALENENIYNYADAFSRLEKLEDICLNSGSYCKQKSKKLDAKTGVKLKDLLELKIIAAADFTKNFPDEAITLWNDRYVNKLSK